MHGYDDVYIPANTSHAPYYLSYDYADDYDSYDYASYTYAQRVAPAERARAARDERAHPSKGIDGPYDRSYQPARFFATAPRNGTARGGGGDGAAAPAALGPHGSVTSEDQFFYTPVPQLVENGPRSSPQAGQKLRGFHFQPPGSKDHRRLRRGQRLRLRRQPAAPDALGRLPRVLVQPPARRLRRVGGGAVRGPVGPHLAAQLVQNGLHPV